jgi:tight adherence protein C
MQGLLTSSEPVLAVVFAALAVALVITAIYMLMGNPRIGRSDQIRRRLDNLTPRSKLDVTGKDAKSNIDRDGAFMVRVLEPMGGLIVPSEGWQTKGLQKQLVHAGLRSPQALYVLLGAKLFSGAVAPLLTGMGWSIYDPLLRLTDPLTLLVLVLAGFIGFFLPDYTLTKLIEKRRIRLVEGFPDALDMLVVCVEAGLGLDAAISRVASELRLSHPDLAAELELNSLETRAGKSRDESLRSLSERMGIEEVQAMVTLLIQADKFGTSVGTALRSYSEEMRVKRIQRAREKAAKLPVQMLFPVMVFIFPALFLVILGPAVVSIANNFTGAF